MELKQGAIWPNFFLVGPPKCGTTSLYEFLCQHPQIYMSPLKEPRFFSRVCQVPGNPRISKERDYLKLFQAAGRAKAVGEASTDYLWDELAPYRIKEKIPGARIIAILRDPIDRAFSEYLFFRRFGVESHSSFYEALLGTYGHRYVGIGLYNEQLRRYFRVFGRGRVLVLMFEDLKRNPLRLLRRIAALLEIDAAPFTRINAQTRYNPYSIPKNKTIARVLKYTVGIRARAGKVLRRRAVQDLYIKTFLPKIFKSVSKPPLEPIAVALLQQAYRQDVQKLEKLLGRPLPELRRVWISAGAVSARR
jgi:hypothetical protein